MRTPQIKIRAVWYKDGSTRAQSTWPVDKIVGNYPDAPETMLLIQISRFDRPRPVSKLHVTADIEVDGDLITKTWREWENDSIRGDRAKQLHESMLRYKGKL